MEGAAKRTAGAFTTYLIGAWGMGAYLALYRPGALGVPLAGAARAFRAGLGAE